MVKSSWKRKQTDINVRQKTGRVGESFDIRLKNQQFSVYSDNNSTKHEVDLTDGS